MISSFPDKFFTIEQFEFASKSFKYQFLLLRDTRFLQFKNFDKTDYEWGTALLHTMKYVNASRLLDLNWLYIFKKSQSYRSERYPKSQCCNMVLLYTVYPFSEWVIHTESKVIDRLYLCDLLVGQLHKSSHVLSENV